MISQGIESNKNPRFSTKCSESGGSFDLQVLDREVGGAGRVADAAGVGAVADVYDALKAGVELIEHAEVGTDTEGENGRVNRDLVGLGVLVLLDVDRGKLSFDG